MDRGSSSLGRMATESALRVSRQRQPTACGFQGRNTRMMAAGSRLRASILGSSQSRLSNLNSLNSSGLKRLQQDPELIKELINSRIEKFKIRTRKAQLTEIRNVRAIAM